MRKSKGAVSIKQLAESLNLSPGTISIVLNGHGDKMRISKATQSRVLEAAREMGYQPNIYAKRLRQGEGGNQHKVIAVFNCYMKNVKNILGRLLYGIQTEIYEKNLPIDVLMQSYQVSKLSEKKEFLSSSYCNGAIIYGVSDEDIAFLLNETFDIPIVIFNRPTEKYGSVYVEDYEAGRRVAHLFASSGCKNVGLIMPSKRSRAGSMRQLGFLDGCRQDGLLVAPQHIQEDLLSTEGGYAAAKRMLQSGTVPEGLFVQISEMAAGAVRAIYERGLSIPDDVKLVSYGDSQFEEYMTPSLTAIRMPMETMAAECLELVLNMIETNDWRPITRIEPLEIKFRESCLEPEKEKK
jgi:DNA-binding LacI/PurR family transcriptional regulator